MGNPIVHIEIAGKDGPVLESFYSELFDWKISRRDQGPSQYGFLEENTAGPIGGGIRHEPEGQAEVVFYVEVPDLEQAVEKATSLGAAVRIPPMSAGDITFALITDPEGNPVGLVQKDDSRPSDSD